MNSSFCFIRKALLAASCALFATWEAGAAIIHTEDFSLGDGGYTVADTGGPVGPWTYDGTGTWFANGTENNGAPSHSRLTSPTVVVTTTGFVQFNFDHRYSFEAGLWDAGAVFVSINGGVFTQIPNASFTANGYTGFGLIGNHDLLAGEGFNGDSPDYATGAFITSSADLGSLNAGDTVAVQFLGAWDEFAKGSEPNWQIDSVRILDAVPEPSTASALLLGLASLALRRRKA